MDALKTQESFLKAYDEYADAIFRHIYFRLFDRTKAEDIMQDTFCKTWEYISSRETEIENIRAFLYRVANNLIVDEFRKKKVVSLDELEEQGFTISESQKESNTFEIKAFQKALDSLEKKHQSVIIMRFIDELSLEEISSVLGKSQNTISVRIHRAMTKLREEYKKLQGEI